MTLGELMECFANTFIKIIIYSETDNIEDVFHEDYEDDKEMLEKFSSYTVDSWCCFNKDNVLSVSIYEERDAT